MQLKQKANTSKYQTTMKYIIDILIYVVLIFGAVLEPCETSLMKFFSKIHCIRGFRARIYSGPYYPVFGPE